MKTSVSKMMMSLALMGCLIIGASDASAQSRSRSQGGSSSSRSQSAAVSRPDKSTAPTVSRTSSSSSSRITATPQVSRTTTTPQVSRNTTTPQVSRTTTTPQVSRTTTTPQVSRTTAPSSSSSTGRTTVPSSVSRSDHSRQATLGSSTTTRPNSSIRTGSGATTRGGNGNGNSIKDGNHISTDKVTRPSESVTRQTATSAHISSTPGGATTRPTSPGTGNDKRDKKPGNSGKPGNGGKPGNSDKPHGGDKPGQGGHQGYDNKHRYDYGSHHYRDEFKWNYTHHNWGRPLPPPARPHRPAPWVWYRPTIPAGWHPYAGAPIIDRILGLVFGSLYEASLDHLYYSGYYIDGYADGIIYLRDVPMLNLYWPDVMLNYEYNRLVNAQFVYHSSYYDMSRYNRVYRSLSRIYGTPVYRDGMTISWYGGNSQGYVTLSMVNNYGDYYTTLSIGY